MTNRFKIATILTKHQTIYFKYRDTETKDLKLFKIMHPIDKVKLNLRKKGFININNDMPLHTDFEYHLFI